MGSNLSLDSIWVSLELEYERIFVIGADNVLNDALADPVYGILIGLVIYCVPFLMIFGFGVVYTLYQLLSCYMAVLIELGEPAPGLEFFYLNTPE